MLDPQLQWSADILVVYHLVEGAAVNARECYRLRLASSPGPLREEERAWYTLLAHVSKYFVNSL